ncbi:hypothetical protein MNBD_GAMMA25-39 [hydrothermal vent metagenome]|uniref:Glycosyltransferase n=1 Tax=hydrothermal vent metagenome TaxID=652676 RepID=A0A3B1BE16_9ZZZZ
MKILVLCTSPGLGGLELYAEREWKYFQQQGYECHFSIAEEGRLAQRNGQSSPHLVCFSRQGKLFPFMTALKLARYIDRNKIDVIHMHWGKELNLAGLAKWFSRRKPKLFYTRHMGITRPKKDFVHRFFYAQIDRVLTISKQVEKEAQDFLPLSREQITLLYLGVEDKTVDRPDCNGLSEDIKKSQFKVALFGRIEHGKGQHILVEAMMLPRIRNLDISATFIGQVMDGNYFDKLKKSVKQNGLEDRVAYMDFVDNTMAVMPCFDVVVLLTYCETFGLVLVEAMRSGVAVIGTDAGGVPEIIEHRKTGMLVSPGDAAGLAEVLEELYHNDKLKFGLAQAGKNRADKEFNNERHFSKLEQLLTVKEI